MSTFTDEGDLQTQLWRRAYDIFERALECPREERESFARRETSSEEDLFPIVLDLLRNASEESLDEADLTEPESLVGATLGRYHITAKLGRGAMGRVYQAHDNELGRPVALKFLRANPALPNGGDPARRLVQEARAASALNHPNIVTVFDVVRHDSEIALAMELVEGSSLREYCGSPQPLDAVIRWGRQIAGALSATHAQGIIHRDIKPENVMLRRDGYIKVLDFGLARASVISGAASRSTLFGVLGGTLNYMSPEQTRGDAPLAASDVFSLGVLLYELACGRHPFQSSSPIDTAYAIAHADPKLPETFRPDFPIGLSSLLIDMMAKGAAKRPSAKEVEQRFTILEGLLASRGNSQSLQPVRKRWQGFFTARGLLATGGAMAVFASAAFVHPKLRGRSPEDAALAPIRYSISLPAGYQAELATICPKGEQLIYQAVGPNGRMLYRRFLDSSESRAIAGSENGEEPFFSPDGFEIGFFNASSIRIANSSGLREVIQLPQTSRRHGFWGTDGFIYFDTVEGGVPGIWRVSAHGGKPELVLNSLLTDRGYDFRFGQQLLPHGLLYSVDTGPVSRSIEWLETSNHTTHRLIERGMGGQVTPTGHLLYYWNGSLMAAPFDAESGKLTGSPVEVLTGVNVNGWMGPNARVASNGTLVYLRQNVPAKRSLSWVTQDGKETTLPLPPALYIQAEVSPEGHHIAIVRKDGQRLWTLWTYELQSGAWNRLLESTIEQPRVVWSPDSRSLVVGLQPDGGEFPNLYRVPVANPEKTERLTEQPNFGQFPMSWSDRANSILFLEGIHPNSQSDIMILPLSGDRHPRAIVATPAIDRSPSFSPDGRWFVYSTSLDGQVYLQDVTQKEPPRRISGPEGGSNPLWAPNGKRIFFLSGTDALNAVSVDNLGRTGPPRQLMTHGFKTATDMWTRGYSIAPDGRLLLVHELPRETALPSEINVVVNWFTELKSLVPVP